MELTIRAVTADLWPALEDLFDTTGPVGRCWCMYWRIGAAYRTRPPQANREDFRAIVIKGPPPGLLAFDGQLAVGWCQMTPREDLPRLDRNPRLRRVDAAPVWSISCSYVRKGYRKGGVTTRLIVVRSGWHGGAGRRCEAYPLDPEPTPSSSSTGFVSSFERMGFVTVARRDPGRPIMRYRIDSPV